MILLRFKVTGEEVIPSVFGRANKIAFKIVFVVMSMLRGAKLEVVRVRKFGLIYAADALPE